MEELTKENILSYVDERTLYQYYFPLKIDLRTNKYKNPFRADKRSGSCHFSWWRGKFYFFDKATGEAIDVFAYLMNLHGLSFYNVLRKINHDFSLNLFDPYEIDFPEELEKGIAEIKHKPSHPRNVYYKVTYKKWDADSLSYWIEHHISKQTIDFFDVKLASKVLVNRIGTKWDEYYDYKKNEDPCYVYRNNQNGTLSLKFYRPLGDPETKWRSSLDSRVLFGYDKLCDNYSYYSKPLIISSSFKDGMCLHELGYPFVCPLSESSYISAQVIRELKYRFPEIYILFDSDTPGRVNSHRFSVLYDIPEIKIPRLTFNNVDCKDIAEISRQTSLNFLNHLIDYEYESIPKKKNSGILV